MASRPMPFSYFKLTKMEHTAEQSEKKFKSYGIKYGDWCGNLQVDISNCGRNKTERVK